MAPSLWFAKGIPGIIFMAKQYTAKGASLKNIFTKIFWSYSLQKTPYPGNWLDRKLLFLKEGAVNIHACKHPGIAKLCITDWNFLSCVGLLHTLILLHILISSFLLQCPLENLCLQEFEQTLGLLHSNYVL